VRVLVTAGGTREPIDAVRYVGNRSSGRMGFAVAAAAARRGAHVTVIAANVGLPRHPGVVYVEVETAVELRAACLEAFPECDVLVMAAAVADFAPVPTEGKIKKDGREGLDLELRATPDVLAALGEQRRPGQTLVGFAAEHGEGAVAQGRGKLARKNLDAVVVNDIGAPGIGFDSTENEVTLVTREAERHVPKGSKEQVAGAILDMVLSLRSSSEIRVES
jgi:phosphopantothenoylcysteine decarboxylase/phosphopantothenate--cysteine ligase